MKTRMAMTLILAVGGVMAAVSCRQSDMRTATIDVPEMADPRSLRIVTNAALDEVVGQYDGTQNDCEVDLARKVILCHEGDRLLRPEYRRLIETRIAEVGFQSRVSSARPNPPAPVLTVDGPIQLWPGRVTAAISAPDMKTIADANVIVDAIAYARLGHDDPRVSVSGSARRLTVRYESMLLSQKNIEQAIAAVGFEANNTPAKLGGKDSLPHGWNPIAL